MNRAGPSTTPETLTGRTLTGQFAGADILPGAILAQRFRIESTLGIGGMGVVYRATDLALGVPIAVKLLRPELATRPEAFARFRQELLLARQVSSPRVVRIHDIAQHQDRWLISMDLIEGESLDRVLDRRGALPVPEALKIARQLAEGLAAAHAREVIHRDLKPSNVLIDSQGDARISDFGVARSLGSSGFTQAGVVVGTPDYLSPEQATGGSIDGRSDLYALGLILYEMLTGRQAFTGTTAAESLSQRLVRAPPPVTALRSDVPPWVGRLVDRLLQPRPAHRFADAAALIRAVDERRVPLNLRPGRRTGLAFAAVATAAALLAWAMLRPPAAPPVRIPDRIVVLAETVPAVAPAAWAAAVEQVRQGLAELPAVAVVDGDRTAQAQAQSSLADGAPLEPSAISELVPARRSLWLTAQRDADGYRLQGELRAVDSIRRIRGAADPRLSVATERFGQALAASLGAEGGFPEWLLPREDATLDDYGRALLSKRAGRPEEALAPLRRAVERESDYAPAWLALGELALATGYADLAGQAARQGLAAPAPGRLRLSLRALADQLGAAQLSADLLGGENQSAAAELRARLAAQPDDLAGALRLGQLLGESGDYAGAESVLQALLARDPSDPRAWFLRGKYSILRGDPRRAVDDYLLRALLLYKRGRNPHGEAETANALGIGYSRLGQTGDAEEQYRRALALRRSLQDRRGTASSLHNLAQVAVLRGDVEQADGHLTEARALYESLQDRGSLAMIDRELGLLAEERGEYAAALDAYRRVLRVREQEGDVHGAAESQNDIGFAHYQLGDYDSAQVFWRQAGDAFARLDDPRGALRAQQNLGLLHLARGQWNQARTLLEQALAEAERRQLAEEAAVCRRNLAELEIVQGHIGAALAHLDRARTLFAELQDQRGSVDAALLRARAMLAVGALDAAADILAAAEPDLGPASREQRALAALLRAELAGRQQRDADARHALAQARDLAESSGVAAVRLVADTLDQAQPKQTLLAIQGLGNVPLQLLWHQLALQRDLVRGDRSAAVRHYRAAASLIEARGDYAGAFELHRLGGLALAAGEDRAAAREAAAAALQRLSEDLPEPLRKALDADPQVVAFREAGHVE